MKDKKWTYYSPVFESEQFNPAMLKFSPWTGHKRFAYDYVRFMTPAVIVELGSYYGCSAFSFLQAVKDGNLKSVFYGVDTWAGDDYTQTDYKEDIYGAYKLINDECFSDNDSHMLRMTFDEALSEFEDNSIDLLHIDGSHSYEDVKHDWLTWKDKVRENGVVFFHDVGEDLLFGEKMGSHIFWEELKSEMPYTLEFKFSNGLGILFKRKEEYLLIKNSVNFEIYQSYINLQDTINKDELRKDFFKERDFVNYNSDLKSQVEELNRHLEKYREDSDAKQTYIEQLENEKQEISRLANEKTESVCKEFDKLKSYVAEKEAYISELENQMRDLKAFATEKEKYALELEMQKAAIEGFAKEKEAYAESLIKETAHLKEFAEQKDHYATSLEEQLKELKDYAEGKATYANELEKQVNDLNEFAHAKENYVAELETRIASLNTAAEEREASFKILQQYASDTENNLNREIEKLLSEIEELKTVQSDLSATNEKLSSNLDILTEKLKRLPFGTKLLKGIE